MVSGLTISIPSWPETHYHPAAMSKAATPNLPPEIAQLGFEEALAQLEAIVRQLEGGQGKLDDAISAYEKGSLLRRHCEARLKEAEARIEKIAQGEDGSLSAQPADF